MESAGFLVSTDACGKVNALETITEEKFAGALGELCLCMAGARLRRGMWLFGWPVKLQRMLAGDGRQSAAVVESFKADYDTWQAFLRYDGQSSAEKALRVRSWFNFTSVRQVTLGLQELG